MGNESPEFLALLIIVQLINSELDMFSLDMTDSQKKLYDALVARRRALQAEISALESNTTN